MEKYFLIALIVLFSLAAEDALPLGRWTPGRLSTVQYQDAYTGVSRPPNENHFAYEFNPDGTYTFTGLMQTTLYNCTTSLFAVESGRYSWRDGVLALDPQKNPFQYRNSCAPSSAKEGPGKPTARSYRVRLSGQILELVSEGGDVQKLQKDK